MSRDSCLCSLYKGTEYVGEYTVREICEKLRVSEHQLANSMTYGYKIHGLWEADMTGDRILNRKTDTKLLKRFELLTKKIREAGA